MAQMVPGIEPEHPALWQVFKVQPQMAPKQTHWGPKRMNFDNLTPSSGPDGARNEPGHPALWWVFKVAAQMDPTFSNLGSKVSQIMCLWLVVWSLVKCNWRGRGPETGPNFELD